MEQALNRNFSIINIVEKVIDLLTDDERKASAYQSNVEIDALLGQLGEAMNRTPISALHFVASFHLSSDGDDFTIRDMARFLKISISEYRVLYRELDKLAEDGLLQREENYNGKIEYSVDCNTRKKVYSDEVPLSYQLVTDVYGLSELTYNCLKKIESSKGHYVYGLEYLQKLVNLNPNLPICAWAIANKVTGSDLMIAFLLFTRSVNGFTWHSINDLSNCATNCARDRVNIRKQFIKTEHFFFRKGLVSMDGDEVHSQDLIVLTEHGKEVLVGEDAALYLDEDIKVVTKGLISPESIGEKALFFNDADKKSVARLESMLSQNKYDEVCSTLKGRGMSPGITILFYGGPGTGKTETALQLARITGRPIYQVDISSIKDKWVGESEKKAKSIFTEYKKYCKSIGITPILLLNEADALINKRIEVERSVDQMSNALQNIFLEEIEKFEGILIATTNLQNNFDAAFDRRFLFKVKFENPSAEIRANIMMERLPMLDKKDACYFAEKFDLSGGQVENVARKVLTESLLTGASIDKSIIEEFCAEETSFRKSSSQSKGFGFLKQTPRT